METLQNISLKKHNSFGIDVKAAYYTQVRTIQDIKEALLNTPHKEIFILSGGSNMLLTKDIDAHVVHVLNKGISVVSQTDSHVIIEVAAGENWHDLVLWTIENNLGGIENLALIPGCAGAAPIQNIGAYGVEIKDSFVQCQAIALNSLAETTILREACDFDYRSSIFKTVAKNKYLIYNIQLKLSKAPHVLITQYGDIEAELQRISDSKKPNIALVAEAVMNIRASKLPDPKKLGNSGSFFKNPLLDKTAFEAFISRWPSAPYYALENGQYKIPGGWLIEHAGLKGYRDGAVGVHEKQALVLVNYGGASGKELLDLANKVISTVLDVFSISLVPEVNILPCKKA